jgi:hypothetical protein
MSNKKIAIIGYTGLIGKNLLYQYQNKFKYIDLFNSKNANKLKDKKYDLVFCSAMPAEKWIANKFPKEDTSNRDKLIKNLSKVSANLIVLISTIDVHLNHAYGKNRRYLEKFVENKFSKYLIIRLPAVFGRGLKKNIIFDLLKKNKLENIYINDFFQWYDLSYLRKDIEKLKHKTNNIYELYSCPVENKLIVKLFKDININQNRKKPIIYNIKPKTGYYINKNIILNRIKKFINEYKL